MPRGCASWRNVAAHPDEALLRDLSEFCARLRTGMVRSVPCAARFASADPPQVADRWAQAAVAASAPREPIAQTSACSTVSAASRACAWARYRLGKLGIGEATLRDSRSKCDLFAKSAEGLVDKFQIAKDAM